jgi:pSer/pThr/pTyr-binding forkhead associated (FHA) protein
LILNCRKCHIRAQCIEQSANSPSVKMMMHRAFSAGSDTQEMWGLLQMNCLLAPQEEQAAEPAPAKPPADAPRPAAPPKRSPRRAPVRTARPRSDRTRTERPARPVATADVKDEALPSRYCLALQGGHHRIALATVGEILLGRFDPGAPTNPDIDLSFDDGTSRIISRRHARIISHDGHHLVEDMGSTNGTLINGKRLRIGQKILLQSGDRVTLGNHEFLYRPLPGLRPSSGSESQVYLWGTFTGHRFSLPLWGEVIVGRHDPIVGFSPDIDLAEEEEASQVVARRHVKIIARQGRHYVEDMGSANGTKLNGVRLGIGARGLLDLGDHLWLGGCVLVYDVEV